jgi:hypothetical protein
MFNMSVDSHVTFVVLFYGPTRLCYIHLISLLILLHHHATRLRAAMWMRPMKCGLCHEPQPGDSDLCCLHRWFTETEKFSTSCTIESYKQISRLYRSGRIGNIDGQGTWIWTTYISDCLPVCPSVRQFACLRCMWHYLRYERNPQFASRFLYRDVTWCIIVQT